MANTNLISKRAVSVSALLVSGLVLLPVLYLFTVINETEKTLFQTIFNEYNYNVFKNSFFMASASAFTAAIIGVPLAWMSVRWEFPLKKIFTVLIILPLAMPSYINAYSYKEVLGSFGILSKLLGFQKMPFEMDGFIGCWISMTMVNFPFVVLLTRAALLKLDRNQEDAAKSLGKSNSQVFKDIILPRILPGITAGMLLVFLYAMSDYGTPAIMNYSTFTSAIFMEYESGGRIAAAALSLILIFFTISILFFEHKIQTKGSLYSTGTGTPRPADAQKPGFESIPLFLYSFAIIIFSLGIPVITLIYWFYQGSSGTSAFSDIKIPMINSFLFGAGAAIVTVLLALPLTLRASQGKKTAIISQRLTFLGNAIPGVVIGFALVRFASSYHWLYQTIPLVIIAYSIRFLPQAAGALDTGFKQINPKTAEASNTLGVSETKTFFRVILPQLKPAVLTGLAMVFITTVKELPITLILSPPGIKTLPGNIWNYTEEAAYSKLATPGLLILFLSGMSVYFILKQEKKNA